MEFLQSVDWNKFHAWRKLVMAQEGLSLIILRLAAITPSA